MNTRRTWLIIAVLACTAGAFAARPFWRWYNAPPAGHCPICLRHEHKESMVKFQADGEPVTSACCLSCALTYGRQTHKPVKIVTVTDHDNAAEISPEHAAFVVGSDISPCTHMVAREGEEKEAYAVQWDRCLPSILAFGSADAAAAFRAQHGGRVRSLSELMEQTRHSGDPMQ